MAEAIAVLGIESSCDDTAAAVVRRAGGRAEVLSSIVAGQDRLHAAYGGVVPEIAARAHAGKLDLVVERALEEAGLGLPSVDAVAVTAGPGLIGGVLSGVMCAKGLAAGSGKPIVGVNHLAGHALTPRMTDDVAYPYLVLLASGGHCQFLAVEAADGYRRFGGTIDDAPGEAFDKVARMLGLDFPGGPAVEAAAAAGNPHRFDLPRPLLNRDGEDMSFSGLKTAVLRARDLLASDQGRLSDLDRRDLSASFQMAVADTLSEKSRRACNRFRHEFGSTCEPAQPVFAVAGGVAANALIRTRLEAVARNAGFRFIAPAPEYCTDNAAMIAWAGLELFAGGKRDGFDLSARPRWPLDPDAPPILGSGRKRAKA